MLKEEFHAVVRQHEAPLIRYAVSILHNEHDAQDIVQDGFIRFLKECDLDKDGGGIDNVRAWLYRVVHNLAVNHLRKRQLPEKFVQQEQAEDMTDDASPDKHLSVKEECETAGIMLSTLKEREQQILILKIVEDKSYKEIASLMNLTISNIGFILHNALGKLRKKMTSSEPPSKNDQEPDSDSFSEMYKDLLVQSEE